MLLCLRFHALIGRHYENDIIDPQYAGEHIVNEPLVARHIDKSQSQIEFPS